MCLFGLVFIAADSLFRSRSDLAEALELLKAQVNPNLTQEQETEPEPEQEQEPEQKLEPEQAGLEGSSPTQKDAGV